MLRFVLMRKWIIRLNEDRSLVVLGGLTVIAAVLRLRQYATGRSFWHDEATIGLNIVNSSFGQLLLEPLWSDQIAPPGFLAIASLTKSLIGTDPQTLRLIPLGFSLGGLLAAWLLARRSFRTLPGQATFIGLLGFAPVLVYYSSEFKQYSGDVTITILLLLAFSRRHEPHGLLVLAIGGAASMWISHPSLIVLVALGGILAIEALQNRRRIKATIGIGIIWGLTALGFLAYASLNEPTEFMQNFWVSGYAPLPTSHAGLVWYRESVLGLIYLLFRQKGLAIHEALEQWFDSLNYFLLAATSLAAVWAAWRRRIEVLLVLAVGIVAIFAAGIHAYPFRGRLILYLLPILVFLIAIAVDEAAQRAPRLSSSLALAIIVVVAVPSTEVLFNPHNRFDIESAFELVEEGFQDGDAIGIGPGTAPAWEFYKSRYEFEEVPIHRWHSYNVDEIVKWAQGRRVWFIAGFLWESTYPDAKAMLAHDAIIEEWSADSIYLLLIAETG